MIGMEAVWYGEFLRLFQRYPQRWHLIPSGSRPGGNHWEEFRDGAKVRFCCQDCGHGWTSMKGRVMFWFFLDVFLSEGWILFQLFGQRCLKCNTNQFENAMWYPEEVVKVMTNVCNRMAEVYYGFPQCPQRSARRPGRPRNPHNRDLCQACFEGVCNER
uniref:3CxxC-type domain-containing protein n=1 Tax=Strigamia maritima TaxID=126957 RepID=T1ISE7_STRMM